MNDSNQFSNTMTNPNPNLDLYRGLFDEALNKLTVHFSFEPPNPTSTPPPVDLVPAYDILVRRMRTFSLEHLSSLDGLLVRLVSEINHMNQELGEVYDSGRHWPLYEAAIKQFTTACDMTDSVTNNMLKLAQPRLMGKQPMELFSFIPDNALTHEQNQLVKYVMSGRVYAAALHSGSAARQVRLLKAFEFQMCQIFYTTEGVYNFVLLQLQKVQACVAQVDSYQLSDQLPAISALIRELQVLKVEVLGTFPQSLRDSILARLNVKTLTPEREAMLASYVETVCQTLENYAVGDISPENLALVAENLAKQQAALEALQSFHYTLHYLFTSLKNDYCANLQFGLVVRRGGQAVSEADQQIELGGHLAKTGVDLNFSYKGFNLMQLALLHASGNALHELPVILANATMQDQEEYLLKGKLFQGNVVNPSFQFNPLALSEYPSYTPESSDFLKDVEAYIRRTYVNQHAAARRKIEVARAYGGRGKECDIKTRFRFWYSDADSSTLSRNDLLRNIEVVDMVRALYPWLDAQPEEDSALCIWVLMQGIRSNVAEAIISLAKVTLKNHGIDPTTSIKERARVMKALAPVSAPLIEDLQRKNQQLVHLVNWLSKSQDEIGAADDDSGLGIFEPSP